MAGNRRILTFQHSLKQSIHVISSEWRDKGTHLVGYATERPNVALQVVGLIFPDFWACIVGRTGLGVEAAPLCNF